MEKYEEICEPCKRVVNKYLHKHCPKCNASPDTHVMHNYDAMWHEGDIHCGICDTFVRSYDAG
jgi:hypothetical protein